MSRDNVKGHKRLDIGKRLREIREDFYGKHGGQFQADAWSIRSGPG